RKVGHPQRINHFQFVAHAVNWGQRMDCYSPRQSAPPTETVMSHPPAALCPGPISRRSFLEIGSLAVGGLSLGDLFRLRAAAREPGKSADTSVILVWLP